MTEARSAAVRLERLRLKSGSSLDATLDAGVHVFLADSREVPAEDLLQELCEILAGWKAPRRGRVRIGQHAPHNHPATRRQIVSVLGVEPPLIGRTVGEHIERLEAALGRNIRSGRPWLDPWWQRPSDSLTASELRAIAAAVCFSSPDPLVAIIHEPTRLGPAFEPHVVLSAIRHWQQAGKTVVCATTDRRVAAQLGVRAWSLSQTKPAEDVSAEYLVRSSSARMIAARLAQHPSITALRYEETLPRDLWVRGANSETLADAIREAVLAENCELHEMTRLHRWSQHSSSQHSSSLPDSSLQQSLPDQAARKRPGESQAPRGSI